MSGVCFYMIWSGSGSASMEGCLARAGGCMNWPYDKILPTSVKRFEISTTKSFFKTLKREKMCHKDTRMWSTGLGQGWQGQSTGREQSHWQMALGQLDTHVPENEVHPPSHSMKKLTKARPKCKSWNYKMVKKRQWSKSLWCWIWQWILRYDTKSTDSKTRNQ